MRIYGKKSALAAITGFYASGRFPHAILLVGEAGIGRRTLADYAAMLSLCPNASGGAPCMTCSTCRRIEAHIHPDVLYPLNTFENKKYNVDDMRGFLAGCCKKPNDGEMRVCIFEKLDEMSPICQNTLLKEIEEPLPFNRYFFTARSESAVLPTVLSRTASVECRDIPPGDFEEALTEAGVPAEEISELYSLSGGNIGAALDARKDGESAELTGRAVKVCDSLTESRELDCLLAFSGLKTREELFALLGLLTDIFARAAAKGTGAEHIKKLAARFRAKTLISLYDEARRLYALSAANPNLGLLGAECCVSLFAALEKNR